MGSLSRRSRISFPRIRDAAKRMNDGWPMEKVRRKLREDYPDLEDMEGIIDEAKYVSKREGVTYPGNITPPSWVPKKLHAIWRDAAEHYIDVEGNDPTSPFAPDRVASTYRAMVANYKGADTISDEIEPDDIEDDVSSTTLTSNEKMALLFLKDAADDSTDDADADGVNDEVDAEQSQDDKLDALLEMVSDISDEVVGDGEPVEADPDDDSDVVEAKRKQAGPSPSQPANNDDIQSLVDLIKTYQPQIKALSKGEANLRLEVLDDHITFGGATIDAMQDSYVTVTPIGDGYYGITDVGHSKYGVGDQSGRAPWPFMEGYRATLDHIKDNLEFYLDSWKGDSTAP